MTENGFRVQISSRSHDHLRLFQLICDPVPLERRRVVNVKQSQQLPDKVSDAILKVAAFVILALVAHSDSRSGQVSAHDLLHVH